MIRGERERKSPQISEADQRSAERRRSRIRLEKR
jgi:hypothetical protein